MQNNKTYTNSM